jgi:hypothetical protein
LFAAQRQRIDALNPKTPKPQNPKTPKNQNYNRLVNLIYL